MLEKPKVEDEKIIGCVRREFGLEVADVRFLPLGADVHTAVYWVEAENGTPYFLKLRRGLFNDVAVALPKCYADQGIREIIAPQPAVGGRLWAGLDMWKVILYPFIEGHDAYQTDLTDAQWIEFGSALKRIHTAMVPDELARRIPIERYAPEGRHLVQRWLARSEAGEVAGDEVALRTAALMVEKRAEILDLVGRAERLAALLQARSPELTVCHSDIHAGNLLIQEDGGFYIVDWDEPIRAPKERDLMYAGGALMGDWRPPEEEEGLFYQGYGQAEVDPAPLAYYRYERIVQDIAAYCDQLLLSNEGGEDREQSFKYLASNFDPGHTIEAAYRGDTAGLW